GAVQIGPPVPGPVSGCPAATLSHKPMLDHAYLAAVEALRRSCSDAMLDTEVGDERFQADLLGGDLTWETSFAVPGEGRPPRVRSDVTLDWPTWSQTAYRSWRLDGEL